MRTDRLLALIEHLRTQKRPFDFKNYRCGSARCALGELPTLFPDDWSWSRALVADHASPVFKGCFGPQESAAEFFEITEQAVDHLFYPCYQRTDLFGGFHLEKSSPKEKVIANMEAFIQCYSS